MGCRREGSGHDRAPPGAGRGSRDLPLGLQRTLGPAHAVALDSGRGTVRRRTDS